MHSLRAAWNKRYTDWGSLAEGLHHRQYATNFSMFPFRSLRRLIDATEWPRGVRMPLTYRGQHPENLIANWTHKVQGLTHDADFWYSTQTFAISRIPKTVPLAEAKDNIVLSRKLVTKDGIVPGHAGALVYSRGFLYVPIERTEFPGLAGIPAQIWIVDPATLTVVETLVMEEGQEITPWCAINESADLLYTSDSFQGTPSTENQIRIYKLLWRTGPERPEGLRTERLGSLTLVTENGDPFPAEEVQSAIITPNNHLLMVCDTPVGTRVSGLHLFDLMTGVRRWHQQWVEVTSSWDPTGLVEDISGKNPKYHEAQAVAISNREGFFVHVLFGVKHISPPDGVMVMRLDTFDSSDRRFL